MKWRRVLWTASAVGALCACLLGSAMFYAAGQHNLQNEFHGAPWSSTWNWVFIGGSWALLGFVIGFAAAFTVLVLVKKWARPHHMNG